MIKAIIIDDEERARRAMKNLLLNFCEGVEVLACCKDVLEGVEKINELKPDVVFCDIEMPGHSGLELLSFFKEVNFELIFATGYNDFAIHGGLTGEVVFVSADTITNDEGESYYIVRVAPEEIFLDPKAKVMEIKVGMTSEADIIISKKTILDYLLKPINRGLEKALTES